MNMDNEPIYCNCGKHKAGDISHQQMISELRTNPAKLKALLQGLTEEQMKQAPSDGNWSIWRIIQHLAEAAGGYVDDNFKLLEGDGVLGDDAPVVFDRDHLDAMLHFYTGNEAKLSDTAAHLSDVQWQKRGIFRFAGQDDMVINVDAQYVHEVDHDREHLAEIGKLCTQLTQSPQ
jgi:DinB superfamily